MAPNVLRGTIVRMEGRKPHVEVPDLGVGYSFGPCETATGRQMKAGDRVLVVAVGGIVEDIVVVGILDDVDEYERLDQRYWTKTLSYSKAQVDGLLAGKASTGHTHG